MPTSLSKIKILIITTTILLLFAILILEWQFSALRTAPRIDRSLYLTDANLVIVVQPEKVPTFIHSLAQEISGKNIPNWALKKVIPYELGMSFTQDETNSQVDINTFISTKRFANATKSISLSSIENRITWDSDNLQSPSHGILLANGNIQADEDALEQVLYQWGNSGRRVPKSISGDHFFELLFDNRAGQAYLSMASMMTAFDFKFSEENMKIMLSSIQFVTILRAYADISEDDTMSIAIDMEIVPTARNRVGVVNLKGAIDEGFAELGKQLNESHGIQIEGSSDWNEMTIEFRYTISNATPFIAQYLPTMN
jgi:hypothetical protein